MDSPSEERISLGKEVKYWLKRWRFGQSVWSLAHHVSLFGAATMSVAIGFIVQLKTPLLAGGDETLSTSLAFGAAVLSALAAAGGFERKWRANRLSRGRLDELRIDFMADGADLHRLRERLKSIIRMHDQEVLGGAIEPVPSAGSPSVKQGLPKDAAA